MFFHDLDEIVRNNKKTVEFDVIIDVDPNRLVVIYVLNYNKIIYNKIIYVVNAENVASITIQLTFSTISYSDNKGEFPAFYREYGTRSNVPI